MSAALDVGLPPAPKGDHWTLRAACREVDPELFFPATEKDAGRGKEVCRRCPVRNECLVSALESDERFGIWGGLSEGERGWTHGHPHRHKVLPASLVRLRLPR